MYTPPSKGELEPTGILLLGDISQSTFVKYYTNCQYFLQICYCCCFLFLFCFVLSFFVVFKNFEFLRFGELGSVALHTKRRESKAKLII
jgi:hypothetical protein